MSTKPTKYDEAWRQGYSFGHADGIDYARGRPYETGPYTFTPNQRDLDIISLGMALVVLHAESIQTISATMDTQQKLGVAERVLGWLHLISTRSGLYHPYVTLHETAPNPWLKPYENHDEDNVEAEPDPALADWRKYKDQQNEVDDEIPF